MACPVGLNPYSRTSRSGLLLAPPTKMARPTSNPIYKSWVVGFLNPVWIDARILWLSFMVKPAAKRGEKNPSNNSDLS